MPPSCGGIKSVFLQYLFPVDGEQDICKRNVFLPYWFPTYILYLIKVDCEYLRSIKHQTDKEESRISKGHPIYFQNKLQLWFADSCANSK